MYVGMTEKLEKKDMSEKLKRATSFCLEVSSKCPELCHVLIHRIAVYKKNYFLTNAEFPF